MCKFDVQNAYTNLPIHPSEHHLLGFSLHGKYYYDRVLPQGMGTSCSIYESFSTALEWIIRNKFEIRCHHTLEDFIIFEKSYVQCKIALESVLDFFRTVGIPIEPSKTEGPTQCICFVGIELDSVKMEARLPMDKIQNCIDLIEFFLDAEKVTLLQLQKLTGKLCFATSTVSFGRPFLRRLYDLTKGLKKPYWRKRLTNETKDHLRMWRDFLLHFNGRSFLNVKPTYCHTLCSDASLLVGYGAVCGADWICGTWPLKWKQNPKVYNIDVMELYSLFACVITFKDRLKGHHVNFLSDNQHTVEVVNKLTSKSYHMMPLVRKL